MRVLLLIDGVGPVRARAILDELRPPNERAPDPARWAAASARVPAASRAEAGALIALLADPGERSCATLVEDVCATVAALARVRYPDWPARAPDYEQLAAAARHSDDVRRFVSELVIDPPASTSDLAGPPTLDEDYLVLSTVHSAKGLEWDAVHVIAVYDGNFPADMNAGSAEGIAEERRLLYVALTRPRRRLHVYVPSRYYHRPTGKDDAHGYARASRFLTPAVRAHFDVTGSGFDEPRDRATAAEPASARIVVSLDALFPGA